MSRPCWFSLTTLESPSPTADIAMPHLDPEDVAIEVEQYVDAVEAFLAR
jgi:hypothetical protein